MLLGVLLLHVVVGSALLLGAPHVRRAAFPIASLPMLAALAYVATQWHDVTSGGTVVDAITWVGGLDLVVDTRLDGFSLLLTLLVAGMGVAVMAFSASYFSPGTRTTRIAGLLVLFAGSMLGLVLADNLAWLYVCWELTSVTSFLLIGRELGSAQQRTAALQALLVTGAGGLAMLGGFVILASAGGTWSLAELLADPPSGGTVPAGLALVLAGILTKSAQYPFHFWLPGAMVAPTPISAYLHSATMVKAGVYLAARLAPAFALVGLWRPVVLGLGLLTMVAGALRALRQDDLKLLLAFGTVSQLGLMMVLAGAGLPEATKAVCVLLVAHALFKGALFLVVGIVDHETGTRNRLEISGLERGWTAVRVTAVLSAASMAGLPPLVGFIAKESAYEAFLHGDAWTGLVLVGIVAGSVLTFAYSARFAEPFIRGSTPAAASAHAPSVAFRAPAVALVAGTVLSGVGVAPVLGDLVRSAANALDAEVGDPKLALWHGFNTALGLSALTVGLGVVLHLARRTVAGAQARLAPSLRGDRVFASLVQGLNLLSRRVTATVQPGSLPLSIGVILVVVVGTPVAALFAAGGRPDWSSTTLLPAHPVLAVVLVTAALAVATVHRRFAAVLLLGGVGYAMALVFAVQGAPDLALTQFAVETLSVVVFMLVIRHLPERFRPSPFRGTTALRVAVSALVAGGIFLLALSTSEGSAERDVSEEIVARAEPEGGGKNVVNVILVDVRGLDTLGEVTVLAVSAVGVVALARIGRRPRDGDGADREEVSA